MGKYSYSSKKRKNNPRQSFKKRIYATQNSKIMSGGDGDDGETTNDNVETKVVVNNVETKVVVNNVAATSDENTALQEFLSIVNGEKIDVKENLNLKLKQNAYITDNTDNVYIQNDENNWTKLVRDKNGNPTLIKN
jgi:hypothetical protein